MHEALGSVLKTNYLYSHIHQLSKEIKSPSKIVQNILKCRGIFKMNHKHLDTGRWLNIESTCFSGRGPRVWFQAPTYTVVHNHLELQYRDPTLSSDLLKALGIHNNEQ